MDYLVAINYPSGANVGSVIDIKVALLSDIVAEPTAQGDTLYGSFEFVPGKGFVTWKVASQRANMDSDGKESDEGISRKSSLNFIIPKDQQSIRHMLDQADDDLFIVSYKDANGNQRVYGRKDQPVSFIHKRTTGKNTSDLNGYECEFYFDGPQNDFFYNDSLPSPPPGIAPAVVSVNGSIVASLGPGESINFDTDFDFDFEIVGT